MNYGKFIGLLAIFLVAAGFSNPNIQTLNSWQVLPDRNLMLNFDGVQYKYEILNFPDVYESCEKRRQLLRGNIVVDDNNIGCIIRYSGGLFIGPPVHGMTFGYLVPLRPTAFRYLNEPEWIWVYKKTYSGCPYYNTETMSCDLSQEKRR